MPERWRSLCRRLSTRGDADALYAILEALYSHPPRAYHSLAHIGACLETLDAWTTPLDSRDDVEFALWLHDCIYDPKRNDNEERSAEIAALFLRELQLEARTAHVRDLILATKHRGQPDSRDAAALADIDMAILAADPADYDAYAQAIREEYAFAPDPDYRRGRAAFLQTQLARPALFHIAAHLEPRARLNMEREVEALHA